MQSEDLENCLNFINLLHCFPSGLTARSPQDTEGPSLTENTISSCEKATTLADTPITTPINTFTGERIFPFNDSKTMREARQRRVAQVLGGSPISSVPEAGSGAVTSSPTEQTASTATWVSTQVRYDLGQDILSLMFSKLHTPGLELLELYT